MPDHGPDAFASIFSDPSQPTIIGGQAVNLWAEFYSDRAKELPRILPHIGHNPIVRPVQPKGPNIRL